MSLASTRPTPERKKLTSFRLRGLAVTTVAASLFLALLPQAAGAARRQTSAPVVLGADNVITGSTSAMTTVTIPRDATFDAKEGANPDIDITGKGRFVGVFLVEAGDGLETGGVSAFAGRYGFCDAPGCQPEDTTPFVIMRGTEGQGVLPAGDYRLYLITDGAPATVKWRLDGLSGQTKVVPRSPVDSVVEEPQTNISAPGNVAHSYARSYDFESVKGLTFTVLSIQGDAWAAGRYGDCIYRGDPLLPPPVAHVAPECPGGLSLAKIDATVRPSKFRIDNFAQTIYDPGKWTVSSFYEGAALIDAAHALDVTIDIPSR